MSDSVHNNSIHNSEDVSGCRGVSWSRGVNGSDGVNMSYGVSGSNGVNRSDGVNGSYGVNMSEGVRGGYGVSGGEGVNMSQGVNMSEGVSGSYGVSGSGGVNRGYGVNRGEGVNMSDGVNGSYGVNMSEGVNESEGVSGSNGVNRSYGVLNSSGVEKAIFLADKKRECTVFGKRITEERFDEIWNELHKRLNGWYPKFNNAFELYIKAGSEWKKVKANKITGTKDNWKDMPKKAIDYIQSLPEFDAKIFKRITGITGITTDRMKQREIKRFIGNKIKQLREKRSISQQQLAQDLGYESDTAIYLIEKGKRSLPIEKLKDVADYFGVAVEYIIDPNYQSDPVTEIAYRAKALSHKDKEKVGDFIEFLKQRGKR